MVGSFMLLADPATPVSSSDTVFWLMAGGSVDPPD